METEKKISKKAFSSAIRSYPRRSELVLLRCRMKREKHTQELTYQSCSDELRWWDNAVGVRFESQKSSILPFPFSFRPSKIFGISRESNSLVASCGFYI